MSGLMGNMEPIALYDGRIMQVHAQESCRRPEACCIHNPSDHPLNTAPLNWRADRGIMERMCPHGIGHPDPDDIKVQSSWAEGVHGCDGCCRGRNPEQMIPSEPWRVPLAELTEGSVEWGITLYVDGISLDDDGLDKTIVDHGFDDFAWSSVDGQVSVSVFTYDADPNWVAHSTASLIEKHVPGSSVTIGSIEPLPPTRH